jgi:hypothetical protein
MEWLQTALDRARERFRTAGKYPLIGDVEMLRLVRKCAGPARG